MSKFTGPLTITEISADDELWRFDEPLVYYKYYKEENGEIIKYGEIVVPKGFISDGASVPRFLERWWPRWGKWRRPAALHDFLCSLLDLGKPHPECIDRDAADDIFKEAMTAVGVKKFDKFFLYLGARLATWFPGLSKGNVRNDERAFEEVDGPHKTPAVITNKTELLEDLLIDDGLASADIETNRGTILVPEEISIEKEQ